MTPIEGNASFNTPPSHPFFSRIKSKKQNIKTDTLQSHIDSSNALNRAIQAEKKRPPSDTVGTFFTKKERTTQSESDRVQLKWAKNTPPPWPTSSQLVIPSIPAAPEINLFFNHITPPITIKPALTSPIKLPYTAQNITTTRHFFDPSTLIAKLTSDLLHQGLCLLVHGPHNSGKSFFAQHCLPNQLHRKLILLDGSQPRTPKSLETLQTTLKHTPPTSLLVLIDSLESVFTEERAFYGALASWLGKPLPNGLLVIITSTWSPELINTHLMRLPSETVRCLAWPAREETHCLDIQLQLDPETLSFTDAYLRRSQIEQIFEIGEMAWSHQIPKLLRVDEYYSPLREREISSYSRLLQLSQPSSLPQRLMKRFGDYTRSLNRLVLWQSELTSHVRLIEKSAQDYIQRRRPRPHYLYLDDHLHRELLE